MKTLGVKQFQQKKFKLLPLEGSPFEGVLGRVTRNFIAVVSGFSGNGKTEFCIQLAKELAKFGKVGWLSYEQRHGFDLQEAINRNNMEEVSGKFIPIDPLDKLKPDITLLEDMDEYLSKRGSPEFIFIDSLDYTGFTWDDYLFLKNKYGHKKTFIFIAHSTKTGKLKKAISERIVFDGGMNIWVHQYIARPEKNRFGGFEPYVVYEKRAKLLNPAFFSKKKGRKGKGVSPQMTLTLGGNDAQNSDEGEGVYAENQTKKTGNDTD